MNMKEFRRLYPLAEGYEFQKDHHYLVLVHPASVSLEDLSRAWMDDEVDIVVLPYPHREGEVRVFEREDGGLSIVPPPPMEGRKS